MKKITFLMTALAIALSVSAAPKFGKATTKEQTPSISELKSDIQHSGLSKDLKSGSLIRKSSLNATALSSLTVAQSGWGDAVITWKGQAEENNTYAYRFEIYVNLIDPESGETKYGHVGSSVFGPSSMGSDADGYSQTISNILLYSDLVYNFDGDYWDACVEKTGTYSYHLNAGSYTILVFGYGYNAEAETQDEKFPTTEDNIISAFNIVEYAPSNVQMVVADDNKSVTISWDAPALPTGWYMYAEVADGATTLYADAATSPLKVENLEEGKYYSVYIAAYIESSDAEKDDEQGGPSFYSGFTTGEVKATPKDLKATVNGDVVTLSWTADQISEYYYYTIYDAEGQIVDEYYNEDTDTTYTLVPGIYTWDVQAMEVNNYTLYPVSDIVKGGAFETKDIVVPVITSASVESVSATGAVLNVAATDNYSPAEAITFTVMDGETALLTDQKADENGQLTLTGLIENQKYDIVITAKDTAANVSEGVSLSFVATDDSEAPELSKAEIKEVSDKWVTITVEATDNKTEAANLVYVVSFEGDEADQLLSAEDGVIKVIGLTPETAYKLSIKARDLGGNLSAAKEVSFTTLELIPVILSDFNAGDARVWGNDTQLFLYNDENDYPYISLDLLVESDDKISGDYSSEEEGQMDLSYTYVVISEDNTVKAVSATVKVEFNEYYILQGYYFGNYTITFEIMCEDGNLYKGKITCNVISRDGFYANYGYNVPVEVKGENDIFAPTVYVEDDADDYEITAEDNSVTITAILVEDNTTIGENLVIEVQNEAGEKFNAEIEIADTYPASNLTEVNVVINGLTAGTEYTFFFYTKDELGNETAAEDRVSVTITTTGEKPTSLETLSTEMNEGDAYNVLGQKVDSNYNGVIILNNKKYLVK